MPTIERAVDAGADDAHEADDGTGFDSTATSLNSSPAVAAGVRWNTGLRFTNITIPQGDKILEANIIADFAIPGSINIQADIFAEAADNAVDFSTTPDVTSRVRTSASATWIQVMSGIARRRSPGIGHVIQEVIDRSGWVSGNALVIFFDGRAEAGPFCRFAAQESQSPAELYITYGNPDVPLSADFGPRILRLPGKIVSL